MSDALLLTGATGFIGMEVLARYLEHTDRHVYTPIRAESQAHADQRMSGVIRTLFSRPGEQESPVVKTYADRVVALPMDLRSRMLGLAERRREWLAERVGDVIHCAASVAFTAPIAEQLVRSRAADLPIDIFRPSVVVG